MRVDQTSVTVSVKAPDGTILDGGTWETLDGGDITATATKYKPGAMAPAISLGGTVETDTVTLDRTYTLVRDHADRSKWEKLVGNGQVTITWTPMTLDGSTTGVTPKVWTGTLTKYTPPKADSNGTDANKVAIEVTIDG